MEIEVRIYKHWDMDILSLIDSGYPVSMMMRDVLVSYANGQPIHYYIDEYVPFSMTDKKSVHLRIKFPKVESKVNQLLKQIQQGQRGSFVKMLFRNALVVQNLNCYFKDANFVGLTTQVAAFKNVNSLPNVVYGSAIRAREITVNVLGKDYTRKTGEAVKVTTTNPYENMQAPQMQPVMQNQPMPPGYPPYYGGMYGYSPPPMNMPQMMPGINQNVMQQAPPAPPEVPDKADYKQPEPSIPVSPTVSPSLTEDVPAPAENVVTNKPINTNVSTESAEPVKNGNDSTTDSEDAFAPVNNKALFDMFDSL